MASIKIGKKLRMLREKFGYTQQHMANILNVDRSTYSYYETEKTSPDIATLITLSNVFCVGIEELLGQENSTTTNYMMRNMPLLRQKAKILLLMTVLFIIYQEMKNNSLHFIVQFLQQQKVLFYN